MGGQRQAAWGPGCVLRVSWNELAAMATLSGKLGWLQYEKYPDRVRDILGEPRSSVVLSECAAHRQPMLVPEGGT